MAAPITVSRIAPRREPLVLVSTLNLPEAEWLGWRRKGIGGSDTGPILGISPFRTARDVYYDKRNIAPEAPDESNWVQLEVGHLLEDLVARIFAKKTGYRIYQIKKMFKHPGCPWMLADVDYFVELPNGQTAILEIKTTNHNAIGHWWKNGKESIPPYYESQGRHYMAVMDVDVCYFCCLYGNSEDEVILREMHRDMDYEAELIYLEREFWTNHVLAEVPPPYTEDGTLVEKSARAHFGRADRSAPELVLDGSLTAYAARYLALTEEKKTAETSTRQIEKELQRVKAQLIATLGKHCAAVGTQGEVQYIVSFAPSTKASIQKDDLARLKRDHPDIYDRYVTVSESRRFAIKAAPLDSEASSAAA